jgi:hypothetical protein
LVFPGVFATGCASIAKVSCVEWMWVPEEPSRVTNAVLGATEAAEVKSRFSGVPGFICGSAGENVTPGGRPVTSSVTGEENPPEAVTDTETEPEVPAGRLRLDGETVRLKSGGTCGGVSPPEQPQSMDTNTAVKKSGRHRAPGKVLRARKNEPLLNTTISVLNKSCSNDINAGLAKLEQGSRRDNLRRQGGRAPGG